MKFLALLVCFSFGCLLYENRAEGKQLESELINAEDHDLNVQYGNECPFPFGVYGDPEDCHNYYVCVGGKGFKKKCKRSYKFDILRRTCLPGLIAICGNNGKTTTEAPPETTRNPNEKFSCNSFSGTFPHPSDCSKYYTCTFFLPSEKTCKEGELFDAVKVSCQPAKDVHCGNRQRPDRYTTLDDSSNENTESISTDVVTNSPNTEVESESPITEAETDSPTDSEEKTDSTPEPTVPTEDNITTEKHRETAPPETDCEEDDVDCIVDNTGDPDDWFICPDNVGSYPHPSSNRLFIFCMNWIPSVKRCGMEMVFSKERATCVEAAF